MTVSYTHLFDALDGWNALRPAAHEYDALHDIVVRVIAGDAEPWQVLDVHIGDVADKDRRAVDVGDHSVLNAFYRADQADAAHHDSLWSDVDGLAANVDVSVRQCLQDLRYRQAVIDQAPLVERDLVGLGLAAPAGDVDYTRHRCV